MIAYGAYAPTDSSLLRSATLTVLSILVVSLLATLLVFPLVFRFGMDPAQGPDLVFNVLPATFALMPGGQLVGTLFFVLLVVAALTPSMAGIEAAVAWFEQRLRLPRKTAVAAMLAASWALGLLSLLSFNALSGWYPLGGIERFAGRTWFDLADYITANLMLPVGALLTAVFVGWRLPRAVLDKGLAQSSPRVRTAILWMLRLVCPVAIGTVFFAALT
jgi:NSS family neurotransmitter:Na+ symporter